MPKLKILSGGDVIGIFIRFGFSVVGQKGSHVKIERIISDGSKQTMTIPNHRELDRGTLHAIFRQAGRYVAEDLLRYHFYTE